MKILFLDHDGVICLRPQWGKRNSKKSIKNGDIFDPFCPKAIKVLNEIIEKTDCEIIVSSDWRIHKDLEYMKNVYHSREIIKTPIGYTDILDVSADMTSEFGAGPLMLARLREKEINQWLDNHIGVEQWVAVDDLKMDKLKRFVHTPLADEGIKQIGIKEKIINLLTYS